MALKDSVGMMHKYLECIVKDLKKAEKGNKAAAQRVRTCTIKFEKVAKKYRKESIACGKKCGKKKVVKKKVAKKKPVKKVMKKKPVKKVVKKKVVKKKPVKKGKGRR
jgi:hypothetical protein